MIAPSRSNTGRDRIAEPVGYAQAGVPLYLLVDGHAPGGPSVTLCGEAVGDVYRVHTAVKAGEDIRLPAPFELTLDTPDFPEVCAARALRTALRAGAGGGRPPRCACRST